MRVPYLLELLDGTLVNTTALVDQVCVTCKLLRRLLRSKSEMLTSGGGRLAGVDVADNDDVDMSLFLTVDTLLVLLRWISESQRRFFLLLLDERRLPHGDGFSDCKVKVVCEVDGFELHICQCDDPKHEQMMISHVVDRCYRSGNGMSGQGEKVGWWRGRQRI